MDTYDIFIHNIDIADGSGAPLFKGSVAIRDGKIAKVIRNDAGPDDGDKRAKDVNADGGGEIPDARTVIEAEEGWILSPGFFDTHNHNDLYPMIDRYERAALLQGVTTQIVGNCGQSPAPVAPENFQLLADYLKPLLPYEVDTDLWRSWTTTGKYLEDIRAMKPVIRREQLVGHGTIRLAVMKMEDRRPTAQEMERMKDYLREAMEAGAIGLSSGLIYPPGVYSDKEELIELCKVVREYDGVYSTHMRNESDGVVEAVREAIDIGRQSGCKVLLSHLKAIGPNGPENAEEIRHLIEDAHREGIRVINDQYQYNLSSTTLSVLFPPFALKDGVAACIDRLSDPAFREALRKNIEEDLSWENYIQKIGPDKLTVIGAEVTKECEGKSIARIAAERGDSVIDTTFDLLAENRGNAVLALEFCDESLVEKIFCFPHTAIGCDGIGTGSGQPSHPRGYCNHVRMFGVYVREKGLVSWEEGVRKCTSLPADFFGLCDRGYVREGLNADLVVFDRERIGSQADFSDQFREPEGICYVLTDGVIRVDHGSLIK